ncbi:MAG TPA: LuxR C-terminal-related transcriptional regulator [Solirubrobacteraceae bacterium]|nr:LuxR C-terminal-related transcriptional regulator [Solirubrobacteraceae bacterium]
MTATVDVFAGPLGEQLQRRLSVAIAEARAVLGSDAEGEDDRGADLASLQSLIAELRRRLSAAELGADVVREQAAAMERLRQRFEGRFEALERVQAAIAELREVTSPREMLTRAPAGLCAGSEFERAILSLVKGGRMVAEAAFVAGGERAASALLSQLRANPLRLEHTLIETELLRRRRATIVVDADVHPRVDRETARLMGWRSYAAAPLVVGTQVAGVIHADRGPGETLDVLDRDVLWEFATALAQAYESTSLRRTLRDERDQMRQFLDWLGVRSSELTDAPVTLSAGGRAPLAPPAPLPPPPSAGARGRDDRVVFEGLLTRRELDVLRLLADGATNRAVADALVISSGTVKFHVNSILRKLHAANRAEAVTRYLRLMGMRVP